MNAKTKIKEIMKVLENHEVITNPNYETKIKAKAGALEVKIRRLSDNKLAKLLKVD